MPLHIFKMTSNVDDMLALFMQGWAQDFGRDPHLVQDGDIVVLLGHGGGGSTVEFVNKWMGLSQIVSPQNKTFILLMCGQGGDGGSAQVAELIISQGARSVIYSDNMIILVHVMEMPDGLGVQQWSDLLEKEDGETWDRPYGARGTWTCYSNADGPSLAIPK